jgi:hypothetical protein
MTFCDSSDINITTYIDISIIFNNNIIIGIVIDIIFQTIDITNLIFIENVIEACLDYMTYLRY